MSGAPPEVRTSDAGPTPGRASAPSPERTSDRARVRWGILSTADIGIRKVIPGMQKADNLEVTAIASRDVGRARAAAAKLRVPKSFGTYEALLDDPEIDAVYNPLPNHLHVPWTIRALEAGKHVLVEKPVGLSSAEARDLERAARAHPHLKVMEAFMYRHHPQWQRTKQIVDDGGIGELRAIQSFFSYYNRDPSDIRNDPEIGGGGLMDIGCYQISLSRFLFDHEPRRLVAWVEHDPEMNIDRLAGALMEFRSGVSSFVCSTQVAPHQRVDVVGTAGRIEILIPFNAPQSGPTAIRHHRRDGDVTEIEFDWTDQYQIQAELMSRAIQRDEPVPTPLSDAVANMVAIEAVFQSAADGGWVALDVNG